MTRTLARILMMVAAAGLAASCRPPGNAPANRMAPAGPVEVQLQDYQGVLVTVPIHVGDETLPFIFDTAGGVTVVTPQVAERLGLATYGRVTAFRMSGERLDLPRCTDASLGFGTLDLEASPALLDVMKLLPEGWPELGGIVSLDTLRHHAVTLDLQRSMVIVESESSLEQRLRTMHPLRSRFARQAGGASLDVFVEVSAGQGNLWMELDSGNAGPVLLAPHSLVQLGITAGHADGEWSGEIPLTFPGVGTIRAECVEGDLIYDGALNFETMKKTTWTFDLPSATVWCGDLPSSSN